MLSQLGHGSKDWSLLPVVVDGPLRGLNVTGVSCGHAHTAAMTNRGILYTWGDGDNGQLGHVNEEPPTQGCRVVVTSTFRWGFFPKGLAGTGNRRKRESKRNRKKEKRRERERKR